MQPKLKITGFFCLLLIALPLILNGGARIVNFKAYQQNNAIIVEWTSEFEYGVEKYVIEKSINSSNWEHKKDIFPNGNGESSSRQNYSYIDKSIFKANQSRFSYRLKVVDKNGSSSYYGSVDVVTSNISGIRHTWGSIKASFR